MLSGTMALLGILGTASAAELRVPADHDTIRAAVNAARDNDTIQIASGVYTEQVEIVSKRKG